MNAWDGKPPGPSSRTRVLIADDDFEVRLLLRLWLERPGSYDVVAEAADGLEALEAARRHRPELAVLDLAMPRMDGLEATAEIRRLLPETRIVVRSGFSAERMAQRAIDAGADVYLEKAASGAELLAVLDGLLPAGVTTTSRSDAEPPGGPAPRGKEQSTYDLLLDALAVGVLLVDADGRVRSANFAATEALGVPTSRLVGSSLTELLGRASADQGQEADPVSLALASSRPQSDREVELDGPGGRPRWVRVDVRPVAGAPGVAATAAVVVVADVTEDHRLREDLAQTAERQARVLGAVEAPVVVLRSPEDAPAGSSWVVAQANPAARALTGWAVGSTVPEEAVAAHDVRPQRTADDELVLAWTAAGAEWPAAGLPSEPGGATADLLEAAVISAPVGTILLDDSGRLVIANPVADRLLGGALLGEGSGASRRLRWTETKQPVEVADLPVRAACTGVPFDDLELFVTDAEGTESGTYVRISGRPVPGRRGGPVGAVISVLDDTLRKEAERALAATHEELRRSNTELASFASVASHDLLQPLQKIYGYAQLLEDEGLDQQTARACVARILTGCERMRDFTQDLLSYSRLTSETPAFEEVDLGDVVREVVELFEHEIADAHADLRVDTMPTVLGDRVQLGHLFQNLIGNALTYVPSGVRPEIHVHSVRAEGAWQVNVDDNGIGIHPADRERAFAMFERLVGYDQYAGTGIGLALCARVVERHGGRIWIEDSPRGGTRISLTLPDQPGQAVP